MVVACGLQVYMMKGRAKSAKILHLAITIGLFVALLPVVFNLKKESQSESSVKNTALVLLDKSMSMKQNSIEILDDLNADTTEIVQMEFSDGLLAPFGKAEEYGATSIHKTLKQVEKNLDDIAPDWIWLITDGGFNSDVKLPEAFDSIPKYLTHIQKESEYDLGLQNFKTDPVWYTRTETSVSCTVYRNQSKESQSLDLLLFINGEIQNRTQVSLSSGELEKKVDFIVKSNQLGSAYVEIKIAEGQGGDIKENDSLIDEIQVLRDKLRVLRVVGRPTWSSKFLRDYLMTREDIDLVDFHILRGITDRVMAAHKDLALIPFPVEELFVENIESFDLIIWQNFDHQSYSFFKTQYTQNIVRFVQKGGGLLFWSGDLPWDFSSSLFKAISPVHNNGRHAKKIEGKFKIDDQQNFFDKKTSDLFTLNEQTQMKVFPGKLIENTQVILSLDEIPILVNREVKKGRVVQVNTNQLWQLAFNQSSQSNLYHKVIHSSLLWLQKHSAIQSNQYSIPKSVLYQKNIDLSLSSSYSSQHTFKLLKEGAVVLQYPLSKDQKNFSIPQNLNPGVYQTQLRNYPSKSVAIQYPPFEFKQEFQQQKTIQALVKQGFTLLKDKQHPDSTLEESQLHEKAKLSQIPQYESWIYLIAVIGLLFIHWLILASSPIHYKS